MLFLVLKHYLGKSITSDNAKNGCKGDCARRGGLSLENDQRPQKTVFTDINYLQKQ